MSNVTTTIHVKVQTYDPVQDRMIPVPNARLLFEDSGILWDPNLSGGSDVTDAAGLAQVAITYDDGEVSKLNPFVTVTVAAPDRTVPAGAPGTKQFELPEEWVTRHYVKRRIPDILSHSDASKPLEIFVGLFARLRLAYADLHSSRLRNPLALPEDTARALLADYDEFLWIDWLDPDDVMTGVGGDPRTGAVVKAGEKERYPYFSVPPTAPWAVEAPSAAPKSYIDPPQAPVGSLGGGSFVQAGPLAVDAHGFVFLIDGNLIRRFYPDGTLCETIREWTRGGVTHTFNRPSGLALDQYRNLFVADTDNHQVVVLQLAWRDGETGRYLAAGAAPAAFGGFGTGNAQFDHPLGLAVVHNRVVDGEELLAVADSGNHRVQIFRIAIAGVPVRTRGSLTVRLTYLTQFGAPASGSGASAASPIPAACWEPVAVAADRRRRIFVCDKSWHRISRWAPDSLTAPTAYNHEADWEKAGGGSGGGPREFLGPQSVAADWKNETIYVADAANLRVQRLDAGSGDHLNSWVHTYDPALASPFTPTSVAADSRGEVFVADTANQRVLRGSTLDAAGAPLNLTAPPRLVGAPWTPSGDLAHMAGPTYVTYDKDGRLWVSDSGNNRVLCFERNAARELVPAAPRITTDLLAPAGIAFTPEGVIWVVDAGNHRVRTYDAGLVHQSDFGTGAPGASANELNNPRGIVYTLRNGMPTVYVADRDNNRVKVIKGDGTVSDLTTGGGQALKTPEDVALDSQGNLFVADTGNARILQFDAADAYVRTITVDAHGLKFTAPCGVAVDDEDKLIVTDRSLVPLTAGLPGKSFVVRVDPVEQTGGAHKVLAFWDMAGLLRMNAATGVVFYPDLARQVLFAEPQRAVVDASGLMAVADRGQDRVRLLRIYTSLQVNIFDLGERYPDISLRVHSEADWRDQYGLRINVTGEGADEFSSDPVEKFTDDRYLQRAILTHRDDGGKIKAANNAAINTMKTVQQWQRWLAQATRADDAEHRWGVTADRKRTRLKFKLHQAGSEQPWDEDIVFLGSNASGRGIDAWDDSVIVHEMTHWVAEKAYRPRIPFARKGGSHSLPQIVHQNLAFNEGISNFFRFFFEAHFGSADRLRGYPLVGNAAVSTVVNTSGNREYLYGGLASAAAPVWTDPGLGLGNEAYIANGLWQLFHLLTGSDMLFADGPGYWYGHNLPLDEAASNRFSNIQWKALRLFPTDPSKQEFQTASTQYFKQLLQQARSLEADLAPFVQAIYELNNLLMPTIRITEGTSATAPGTALAGDPLDVTAGSTRSFVVQVVDGAGNGLAGYQLHFTVVAGNAAHFAFTGAAPLRTHGLAPPAAPTAIELFRVTNANGIANLSYAPAAAAAGTVEKLHVSYQPDFDDDVAFDPPGRGDNREWTQRRLYMYELRAANKVWGSTGNNRGASVTADVNFNVKAP